MTDALRFALLVAAVVLLAGIFVWSRWGSRLRRSPRPPPVVPMENGQRAVVRPPTEPPPPKVRPALLPEKVVTLRLMAREAGGFPGDTLVQALGDAGLQHGRYGIFHLLEGGDAERSMFSVASLVEPGSFDPGTVATARFPGVSLFMTIPGATDPVQAFDAMVGTARGLAGSLGGELLDEQGSTLSIQRQRYIREEIIQFRLRQARQP